MENKVLVWVTSPLACRVIMQEAKRYAEKEKLELVVVSIQSPITGDWGGKARDLEILSRVADSFDAELSVRYSDNPLKSAYDIIKEVKPACMFTGLPEAGLRSAFVENICLMASDIPVFTVDKHGNAGRFGGFGAADGA